jgi:hypothetical protein
MDLEQEQTKPPHIACSVKEDREIVLSELGEELPHISAVSGDCVLAHVAGLQAGQVACECGRERCWDLYRVSPPAAVLFGVCLFFAALANPKFCTFWFV